MARTDLFLHKEFVYIQKLVNINNEYFVKNLEILKIATNGITKSHYSVPYGKIQDDLILLNGIKQEDPTKMYRPISLTKNNNIKEENVLEYVNGLVIEDVTINELNTDL